MRQGQQNRRGRGRNNNNNNNPRKGQNPLTRSFESNGPDVKLRGTPAHIAEKYMSLARDALSSGDPVLAENFLQHAEHYNRIILAYREQQVGQGGDPNYGGGYSNGHGQVSRLETGIGGDFDGGEDLDDQGQGSSSFEAGSAPRFEERGPRQQFEGGGQQRQHAGQHSGQGSYQGHRERHFQDQQPRPQGQGGDRFERRDRQDRPDRQDRQDNRGDRPDRNERFERRDRMERHDRQPRQDRPEGRQDRPMDRPERPERPDNRLDRAPMAAGDAPRPENGMPRRRMDRPATDRLPDDANDQPEFLRRSVRRPRREEAEGEGGDTPAMAVPVTSDDSGE
ncbi:MAG: DUF4167 domain-containing protein [Hyphomicrobium sp.]|nr:DUF4167 domain-containing protein [Hyphomicrobium sp.]